MVRGGGGVVQGIAATLKNNRKIVCGKLDTTHKQLVGMNTYEILSPAPTTRPQQSHFNPLSLLHMMLFTTSAYLNALTCCYVICRLALPANLEPNKVASEGTIMFKDLPGYCGVESGKVVHMKIAIKTNYVKCKKFKAQV